MPRKSRPLNRDGGVVRDASLVVIASEDTYAVQQYFARFKTRRVQFRVIPTVHGDSAPQHVIDRLEKFKSEYVTEPGDTFWLCIDRDRWPEPLLGDVLRECLAKDFGIAISNPCFELWILLHLESVLASPITCEQVSERLRTTLGGYNKQCCQTIEITKGMVEAAVERARTMDVSQELVPRAPVTQVYRILDVLLAREAITFL